MTSCAADGGCPSDYVAISISILSIIVLVARSTLPCVVHKAPPPVNSSALWIQIIQVFASFNLLVSIVMALNYLDFKKRHWWLSCYFWAVWIEGPLGFGLLLSCRIVQSFHLYNIFVKRRLPPIRTYLFLPLILLPWIAVAACKIYKFVTSVILFSSCKNYAIKNIVEPLLIFFTMLFMSILYFSSFIVVILANYFCDIVIHVRKPLNIHCHMGPKWNIPVMCLHILYVAILVGFTGSIHHIEFRFHELKDLWQGVVVSVVSVGLWVASYFLNEIHNDIAWLQVTSRFLLLLTGSVLVQALFSISSSQPLLSQMSLSKRDMIQCQTMGRALGIPDSGMLLQKEPALPIHPEEPLDKLLLNKRFRQSFMAFADSCLAGESVHFYDDVNELSKIPVDDPVRRIYMARHIIQRYIVAGAAMEVNISHRSRQSILTTTDLAHPSLFKNAENELLQLMNMNLAKDYWSSMYFLKLKDEATAISSCHELEQGAVLDFSPRVSSVQPNDDPFHQDRTSRDSIRMQ